MKGDAVYAVGGLLDEGAVVCRGATTEAMTDPMVGVARGEQATQVSALAAIQTGVVLILIRELVGVCTEQSKRSRREKLR